MSASYADLLQIIDEAKDNLSQVVDCSSTIVTLVSPYGVLNLNSVAKSIVLTPQEDDEAAIYEEA